MRFTRREFVALAAAAPFVPAAESRYRVGITTLTRGGWEKDVFLSFREARGVGYRYVESFIHFFTSFYKEPDRLQKKMDEIGVKFVTISNGGNMQRRFEDPRKHEQIIQEHMWLVRFIKRLGCDHLKINTGPRRPEGTTGEDLKQMAKVMNELGRQISDEGLKFGVHAHMWTQLENRHEVDTLMDSTDPQHVWFVLDTGQITMAGIDPVALTRQLGHRIIEYHLKDTHPVHRGGAKKRMDRVDAMKNPVFWGWAKGALIIRPSRPTWIRSAGRAGLPWSWIPRLFVLPRRARGSARDTLRKSWGSRSVSTP